QCRPTGTILLAINAAVRPGSRIYHPNYKESLENMKKRLTLLFAAALTLSLSSAAFAQDTSSSAPADKKEAKAEKKAAKKEKKAAKKEKRPKRKKKRKRKNRNKPSAQSCNFNFPRIKTGAVFRCQVIFAALNDADHSKICPI